jgi:hypothetical protein
LRERRRDENECGQADGEDAAPHSSIVLGREVQVNSNASGDCRGGGREMLLEHRLDQRRARSAFDPGNRALAANEHEGRSGVYTESLGDVAPLVHIDLNDTKAVAFLACDGGKEAFHPP